VTKLLAPISALLLGYWLIVTGIAIERGWPAEVGSVGDAENVSGEWVTRGTLVSPPLAPLLVQAALTGLALLRRRAWRVVSGAGLAVLGVVYLAAGLAEPFDPEASDPNLLVLWVLRVLGMAGSVALVIAGVAAAIEGWRDRGEGA
jgi:hypothetical protein